jgi:WD40 repeat protein
MSDRDEPPATSGRASLPPSAADEVRLESLLVAFDEALARDGAPGFVVEPELSDMSAVKLSGMRDALRLLEQARHEGLSSELLGVQPVVKLPAADDAPLVRPSLAGQTIGRFELINELGRGGYGVVFLAFDPQIGRQVALKIPRPEVVASEETKRRFLREAKAAGVLEHPHLIPVYEVGEDGPFCYLATAYCPGPTLAQWLKQRSEAPSPELAARLILALAEGVDHAHQRGVLHRDIKPSNVLLEGAGTTAEEGSAILVPRLTDFGLAKLTEAKEDETRNGSLLGTPAYMAPEQAEGRLQDVSAATDIYALGVLLYELLAGRPPFRGETDLQTLQMVAAGNVPPLRRINRNVPRDLEAIALQCLERNPARRYHAACDLAADLQRFLDGEPTVARPATPAVRLFKSARRHPAVAAMVLVLCLAGALLAVEGRWYSRQLGWARAEVQASALERRQFHYVADMNLAHRALSTDHVQQARDLLAQWMPAPDEPDLRDFAWNYLWQQLNGEQRTLIGHEADIFSVCYSPDGTRLATASADHTARLWNPVDGQCVQVFKGHKGEVNCVAFSPDGKLVATASDDGTACIWDVQDGSLHHQTARRQGILFGAAFSPDGKLLAVCGEDKRTVLLDTSNWSELAALGEHRDLVGAVAISPDGKLLATASDDGTAIVWDLAKRAVKFRLAQGSAATCLAFDPQSKRLLVGTRYSRTSRMWNMKNGRLLPPSSRHHEIIHSVAFDRSGQQYGVSTKEGVVELHSAVPNAPASGEEPLRRFHGHAVRVWSLAFSPDGNQLATASADRTVKLWRLDEGNPYIATASTSGSRCLDVTPDGKRAVVAHGDGHIVVYDLPSHGVAWSSKRDLPVAEQHHSRCWAVAIAPDGRQIAVGYLNESHFKIYEVQPGGHAFKLLGPGAIVGDLSYSPDGKTLSVGTDDGAIADYSTETRAEIRRFRSGIGELDSLTYVPGSGILVTSNVPGVVKFWDESRKLTRTINDPKGMRIWSVAFSADGRQMATCGQNRAVILWDVASGQQTATLTGHTSDVNRASFAPDGRTLATVSDDGTVRLWNLAMLQEVFTLLQRPEAVSRVAFAAGGTQLISVGEATDGNVVHFWSAAPPEVPPAKPQIDEK